MTDSQPSVSRPPRRDGTASAHRAAHVTVRDGKAGLPFSKGLLATSIMATGLAPGRAYHAAETVEAHLRAEGVSHVSSRRLQDLTERVLVEEAGVRYAETYRRWQTAQDRQVPLIVLIGGTTGVGKSTVATTVGSRLGIVRIVSTDAVREVMRGIFTREMMPALHTSSFDVPSLIPDPPGSSNPVLAGFRLQVQAVAVGVRQLIRRAVVEGTDFIIEGAHILPGFLDLPDSADAIIAQQLIVVEDADIHANHFAAREQDARSRGQRRYLDHFDDIRTIQDYLTALAVERGVPIIQSYSLDATVSKVMEAILEATTDRVHPPAQLHHTPGDPGRSIRLDSPSTARGTTSHTIRQE